MRDLTRGWCATRFPLVLGLVFAGGCLYPVPERIDHVLADLAARPRDNALPATRPPLREGVPEDAKVPNGPTDEESLLPPPREAEPLKDRLKIPEALLPGGPVPPLRLPPLGKPEERAKAINDLFPDLPALPEGPPLPPGPDGKPLTLAALQRMALANSPVIRQAAARVQAKRGEAIQAGLPPNPTMGYQSDTAGTNGTAGYQGGFIEQTFKTGNKLQLARAVAALELRQAELDLREAEAELLTRVRAGYFGVAVAREAVRVHRALAGFAAEAYRLQTDQVRQGGFAAPYEPMSLRVLAVQARGQWVQARNRAKRAWKQLASTLGLPGLPPAQLADGIDLPVPDFDHARVLEYILHRHTAVARADAQALRARYALRLEQVKPIPDVAFRLAVLKDHTAAPNILTHSVAVGFDLPVWNRNQGGILQAQADLTRASAGPQRVRAELTAALAEAYARYASARQVLEYTRESVLPDQVRVYRGVYERYRTELGGEKANPPNLGDVIVAQQVLAGALATYLTTLDEVWQSAVEIAGLLQTDHLFQTPEGGVAHPKG